MRFMTEDIQALRAGYSPGKVSWFSHINYCPQILTLTLTLKCHAADVGCTLHFGFILQSDWYRQSKVPEVNNFSHGC